MQYEHATSMQVTVQVTCGSMNLVSSMAMSSIAELGVPAIMAHYDLLRSSQHGCLARFLDLAADEVSSIWQPASQPASRSASHSK